MRLYLTRKLLILLCISVSNAHAASSAPVHRSCTDCVGTTRKAPVMSMWAASFGTLANQKADLNNFGYNAKALGGIYGVEGYTSGGSMCGMAFANSNSNIYEDNQRRTARLLGYHLVLYGTAQFPSKAHFMEWLFTGVLNKNKLTNHINSGNQTYDSTTSYRSSQLGARINLAQTTCNDVWRFTLVEKVSYINLYQQDYRTHNSSTARNYVPRRLSDVVTVGGGVRLSLLETNPWVRGTTELRAMGTYDVVRKIQETTANFINSINDFAVSSAPSKWAFQAGLTFTIINIACMRLEFNYDFEMRTKYNDNTADIKLKFTF